MGVFGSLEGFDIHFHRVAVLIDDHTIGQCHQSAVGLLVVEREGGFVSAAPVVFQLAATPHFLELGFTSVFGRGIIEVP